MITELRTGGSKRHLVKTRELVIYTDDGFPCAVAYEVDGFIVHANAGDKNFDAVLERLNVQRIKVDGNG